jgi:hypothetical protein
MARTQPTGANFCLPLRACRLRLPTVALYVFQDRLPLPSVPTLTDIRLGLHTNYDVQPWYPSGEYPGHIITPDCREPPGTSFSTMATEKLRRKNNRLAKCSCVLVTALSRSNIPVGKRLGVRAMKAAATSREVRFPTQAPNGEDCYFRLASHSVPAWQDKLPLAKSQRSPVCWS